MKKTYQKPFIEAAELQFRTSVLTGGSGVGDNGNQPTTDPGTNTPAHPAPGRVF